MPASGMAVEVFLGEAVPSTSSAKPGFFSNTALLPIVDNPPPTGSIVVPNAPRGGSMTANNYTNGFNYINTITSTQEYVSSIVNAAEKGVSFNFNEGTPPSPPGYNIAQTTPSAPSGTFAQAGLPAISNVSAITSSFGDIAASQIQVFRWS